MKVVSNTSPLIGFAKIQRLPLLQQLFRTVIIPQVVYDEFFENCTHSESMHFRTAYSEFMQIVPVQSLYTFSRRLDRGERAVLTLALQVHADLVLLDDRKAWHEARDLQFNVASTRAVLTIAEERNLIESYQKVEEALCQHQFYLPGY
jgi:uncharacterized protein